MAQFTDRIEPKDLGKMPEEFRELLTRLLVALGLRVPDKLEGRKYL